MVEYSSASRRRATALTAAVYLATVGGLFARGQALGSVFLLETQLLFLASLALYLLADKRQSIPLYLWGAALVARAQISAGSAGGFPLSDDIFRYVWEGRVWLAGGNPYHYAPDAEPLLFLRDSVAWPNINHPHLPAIYPPMAQNFFILSALAGFKAAIPVFKAMCAVAELLTLALLQSWLKQRQAEPRGLLLWLFSPLILVEFYASAHLDILVLPFLVASFLCVGGARPFTGGWLLACAGLVKFSACLCLPVLASACRGSDRRRFCGGFLLGLGLIYGPYWVRQPDLGSLPLFLTTWEYNGSVFPLLRQGLGPGTARVLAGLGLLLSMAVLARSKADWPDRIARTMTIFVILTPTLMPWYAVVILPPVLVSPRPHLLWLSGALLFSYHGHGAIRVKGFEDLRALFIYAPFYFHLFLPALVRRMRTSASRPDQ